MKKYLFLFICCAFTYAYSYGKSSWETIIPEPWTNLVPEQCRFYRRVVSNVNYETGENPIKGNVTIPPYVIERVSGDGFGGIMMIEEISGGLHPGWIVKGPKRAGYSEHTPGGGGGPGLNTNQYGTFYRADIDTLFLPLTIKKINGLTFEEAKVKVLVCAATTPPYLGTGNEAIVSSCVLIVPSGCEDAYRQADGWKSYSKIKGGAELYQTVKLVNKDKAWYQLTDAETFMLLNSDDVSVLNIPNEVEYEGKSYPVTTLGPSSINRYTVESVTLGANISNFSPTEHIQTSFFDNRDEGIGGNYFYNMVTMREIHVSSANPYYSEVNGAIYSKDGAQLVFLPWVNKVTNNDNSRYYTIPDGVTTILKDAFPTYINDNYYDRRAEAGYVVVPPSVKLIESQNIDRGFYLVMTSDNPPAISGNAFKGIVYVPKGCSDNYSSVYPYSEMEIKEKNDITANLVPLLTPHFRAQWNSDDNYYEISYGIVDNDTILTYPSEIEYGIMSGNVKRIGNHERGCYVLDSHGNQIGSVRSINIPEGVEFLRLEHKYDDNLRRVSLPSTLLTIGDYCFDNFKKLSKIEIPDGVQSIGMKAFRASTIEEIKLPQHIESLGEYTFEDCKNLTSIILPHNLKRIGWYTFNGCSNIINVFMESATPPNLFNSNENFTGWKYVHLGLSESVILHVPEGSKANYESSPVWSGFTTIVEDMPADSTTSISHAVRNKSLFDVYNIHGQKIRSSSHAIDDLPTGLYIVNGKKIVR